jgi:hypothetical protein
MAACQYVEILPLTEKSLYEEELKEIRAMRSD